MKRLLLISVLAACFSTACAFVNECSLLQEEERGFCGKPDKNGGENLCYVLTSENDVNTLTIYTNPYAVGDDFGIADGFFMDWDFSVLVIKDGVTSIGHDAFSFCYSLTTVTFPSSLTSIGENAFLDCDGVTDIYCFASPTQLTWSDEECDDFKADKATLCHVIDESAWSNFEGSVNVTFVGGLGGYCGNPYENDGQNLCYVLTSENDVNTLTIYRNPYAVGDDFGIAVGFFAGWDFSVLVIKDGVTSIGKSAFYGCSGLTTVTFPPCLTSIGNNAFYGCSRLTSVTIPNSVTSIGDKAFDACGGLTSVTIGSSVAYIGYRAFWGCNKLTSIIIPSSVTSIGGQAFLDCSSLSSIIVEKENAVYDSRDECNAIIETASNKLIIGCNYSAIPNGVTSIGDHAFWACQGLTSVTIPNTVTAIGYAAFSDCAGLTDVTIGSGVTAIDDYAFESCSALTNVICYAKDVPTTSSYAFDGSSYQTATLHVPAASIDKYKNAAIWKDFGNIVELKCATPTIAFANGKLTFECTTEGVEYVATISPSGRTTYRGSSLLIADLTTTYRVSVYAKKDDWLNSEAASIDIDYLPNLDDVNGDGQITIADAAGIVNIILGGK